MRKKDDKDNKKNNAKEEEIMSANALQYRKLDFSKIDGRITGTISSEEALKDVSPIKWSEDVLSGKKKVVITKENDME